jgi:hypothetical protein
VESENHRNAVVPSLGPSLNGVWERPMRGPTTLRSDSVGRINAVLARLLDSCPSPLTDSPTRQLAGPGPLLGYPSLLTSFISRTFQVPAIPSRF